MSLIIPDLNDQLPTAHPQQLVDSIIKSFGITTLPRVIQLGDAVRSDLIYRYRESLPLRVKDFPDPIEAFVEISTSSIDATGQLIVYTFPSGWRIAFDYSYYYNILFVHHQGKYY